MLHNRIPSVLIIGGTTFDHIVYLNTLPDGLPTTIHQAGFQETTGSTGTAKAVALHQLGVPVHLISACGKDEWGEKIEDYLIAKTVSYDLFPDPAGTERHINLMSKDGQRISIFITNSSETIQLPENYLEKHLMDYEVIVLNIISYCRSWAPIVANANKVVWTDLHDYDGRNPYHQPFIDAATYIHLSSDNLPDYKEKMQEWIDQGKKLVICTHAKKGASLLSKESGWIEVDAPEIRVEDTNGAGDNFFAGFLYGWLQNAALQTCMQFGINAASLCVQSKEIVAPGLNKQTLLGKELL